MRQMVIRTRRYPASTCPGALRPLREMLARTSLFDERRITIDGEGVKGEECAHSEEMLLASRKYTSGRYRVSEGGWGSGFRFCRRLVAGPAACVSAQWIG